MNCVCKGKCDAALFIYGMPTNGALWNGIMEKLVARHRCSAVELTGMGKTPFEAYDSNYLESLASQIEALRPRKWHVVGHYGGAATAVYYAARFSSAPNASHPLPSSRT